MRAESKRMHRQRFRTRSAEQQWRLGAEPTTKVADSDVERISLATTQRRNALNGRDLFRGVVASLRELQLENGLHELQIGKTLRRKSSGAHDKFLFSRPDPPANNGEETPCRPSDKSIRAY